MKRAAALSLIVAAVVAMQRLLPRDHGWPSVTLALGFSLVAAYLAGAAAERARLPRLSGYLLFGIVCGPSLLNIITAPMARELQVANNLALALIAMIAGVEMNARRLRRQARAVLAISIAALFGTLLVLALVLWLAWNWLPIPHIDDGLVRIGAAIIAAALVTSFSPTVTIAVATESRSRGPLTDLVIAVVVVSDMLLILVFALAMQFVRWATAAHHGPVSVPVELTWQMAGSLAFGAIAGALFALYLRFVGRELTLVFLGLCALLALAAARFDFELILVALAAGVVVENLAPVESGLLKQGVENASVPVLVVFFAAAGASLRLDALAALGWLAASLAIVRAALIRATAGAGIRFADARSPADLTWMGLISQAGVTLGLATMAATEFPGWGDAIHTLVIALTGIHVLIGPIVFKAALRRAGEVEA